MKSYAIRDSIGNQSHLILPVVLASIALAGIGFAVAALVGTGSDANASGAAPPQTITIKSTISGTNTTVSKVVTHKRVVKGKVVTKNGVVTTLPASTFFGTSVVTTPGQRVTNTRTTTTTHSVTGPTQTVTGPTQTVTSPPSTVTSPPITVPGPTVTVTVTAPATP